MSHSLVGVPQLNAPNYHKTAFAVSINRWERGSKEKLVVWLMEGPGVDRASKPTMSFASKYKCLGHKKRLTVRQTGIYNMALILTKFGVSEVFQTTRLSFVKWQCN